MFYCVNCIFFVLTKRKRPIYLLETPLHLTICFILSPRLSIFTKKRGHMAGLSAFILSLIKFASILLLKLRNIFFVASSSSSAQTSDAHAHEADLQRLMRMLERVKVMFDDAAERNIRDKSILLWLRELRELAREAEYVLDEYMYEVYRVQVEARKTSEPNLIKEDPEQSAVYMVQIPHGMVDRIRDIKSRFEEIAKDREALCLWEEDAPRHVNEWQPTPTSSLVVEQNVFGRKEEKEKVINLLFSDHQQGKVISVLPIVGKGGLGKTILAQLVYNDRRVQEKFDVLIWISVSDDFKIERIARHIIESFTRTSCNLTNLSVLQEKVGKKIRGKKIFLVLDDVWNEKLEPWDSLCTLLMLAKTATILVTTRNVSVARIMQTMDPLPLDYLSDDNCWPLFKHYAFKGIDFTEQSSLVEIGKEIVKKCGGLPLAVKTIASLLRHEVKAQSWMEISRSDLWDLDAGNEILAALQISYERLPMYLKPCFLLCSMFPKGYKYDIDEMCRLWIANGYIEPKERIHPEEVAVDYAKELHERSFFDDFTIEYSKYGDMNWNPVFTYRTGSFRLHEMVHDLAWLNSEKTCHSVERGVSKKIHHLYLNVQTRLRGSLEFLDSINISVLQTLVMQYPSFGSEDVKPITLNFLLKTECLRALHVEGGEVQPLPLWRPKHLRYLSLRRCTANQISPQFVFSAYNLRILTLDFCIYMEMDLEGIGNLINLEFLQLHTIPSRITLPDSLGFLSKLRVLEIHESSVAELPEGIGNLAELHRIVIARTKLKKLPESFCMLSNLKELIFQECNELKGLPENFGKLTSLQFLILQCPRIQYLPPSCSKLMPRCTMNVCNLRTQSDNSYSVGWLKDFNDLKGDLWIRGICNILSLADAKNANLISKHNLETLMLDWDDNKLPMNSTGLCSHEFICSKEFSAEKGILDISICYSENHKYLDAQDHQILENFQPHHNLKHLYVVSYRGLEFPRWMRDPHSCASLVKLHIRRCSYIKFLHLEKVYSLKQLYINDCGRLLYLKMASLPSHLEHLCISMCQSLVEVALVQSLIKLHIDSCTGLKLLSTAEELKSFPSIKELTIVNCRLVKANQLLLSEDCDVHIDGCPNLKEWCLQYNFKYQDSFDGFFGAVEEASSHVIGNAEPDDHYLYDCWLRWGFIERQNEILVMDSL